MPDRISVHLWIYNHLYNCISDQVAFFIAAFREHGYAVSVGYEPKRSALNVLIENFSSSAKNVLSAFCQTTGKRVAVILTEHMDFEDNGILVHGNPFWKDNDYMQPSSQFSRIKNLMDCVPLIRSFFILGDLPEMRNLSAMLPGMDVRSIPFPKYRRVGVNDNTNDESSLADFIFTGKMTGYRSLLYTAIKQNGFSVILPTKTVSQIKRNILNRKAKLVLNLPQREEWRWLSSMRVIAGLKCGRATVSLGTRDKSRISACTYQLDVRDGRWVENLERHLSNWVSLYDLAHNNYLTMAGDYERANGFPHDMLDYWAITDRI